MGRIGPGEAFERLRIERGTKVFVLTGAGISAESGIRTFRDSNGLWEQYSFEEVASPRGWKRDPATVWRFYSQRRAQAAACKPNPAHLALAKLEEALGDNFFLCTQNVDGLHEAAGSSRLIHMHGDLFKSRCSRDGCGEPFEDHALYEDPDRLPHCKRCDSLIRPHICWFGEMPFEMTRIVRAMHSAPLFLSIGTSGAVYPAAGFAAELKDPRNDHPPKTVYVGVEEPANLFDFDECRLGKAGELLPSLFEMVG
jgi:NAD-dependent deacetylase